MMKGPHQPGSVDVAIIACRGNWTILQFTGMSQHASSVREHAGVILSQSGLDELKKRLASKTAGLPPRVPGASLTDPRVVEKRWDVLHASSENKAAIYDPDTAQKHELFSRNIENFVGTVKVPVGVVGPLRVNGLFAQGDFYVPLATTEAALVASCARGAMVISEAGGCSAILSAEAVSRSPGFAFRTLVEAAEFYLESATQMEAHSGQPSRDDHQAWAAAGLPNHPGSESRLYDLRFFHGRRVGPKYGDHRHPGHLRLHRGKSPR